MTMQVARRVPFHPAQCPDCVNHEGEIQRCRAYTTESPLRPILGVFYGESDQSCPCFEARAQAQAVAPFFTLANEEAGASEQATAVISETVISNEPTHPDDGVAVQAPDQAAIPAAPAPVVPARSYSIQDMTAQNAQIHCPRCKSSNPPTAWRCHNCDAKLLPAEGAGERIGLFISFMSAAALLFYLFYRFNIQNPGTAPDFVLCNVGALLVGGTASFFMAFVRLLRRTPEYVKYVNRAERHLNLNAWQSLDDLNHAMDLANDKEQRSLIKQRAKVYEKLGLTDEAARDHLILAVSPTAYKSEGEWVSAITGANADVFSSSMRGSRIKAMLASGKVKAVGFCKRCNKVVELDIEQRCPTHQKVKGAEVEYVIPNDLLAGKLAVMQKLERRYFNIAGEITAMLDSKEAKAIGYCRRCKAAVELDAHRRCTVHPKVKGRIVQYVAPGDEASARRVILRWRRAHEATRQQKVAVLIILLVCTLTILALVFQAETANILRLIRDILP